jgi:crossover junction endodeoxyribonuclease RuvC
MRAKAFPNAILGVDPGTQCTGYALVTNGYNDCTLISAGTIQLRSIKDHHAKLRHIFNSLYHIISDFSPKYMAIEAPFYGKNVQSMLKLGRAQGVALTCGMVKGLDTTEYAPRKIKQSITGNGNAAKEQVAAMLKQLMPDADFSELNHDATDALAVAYCHYLSLKNPVTKRGAYKNWSDFIRSNPDKNIK